MTDKLTIGWAINSICLLHFVFKFRGGKLSKALALGLLTIPYLGAVFYLILVWDIPPPQPMHLRQNRMNHYGRTQFGSDSEVVSRNKEEPYPIFKSKVAIRNPKRKMELAARYALILVCLVIMSYGIGAVYQGTGSYSAWHGGLVFGPLAIIISCIMIYVIVFKWNKLR